MRPLVLLILAFALWSAYNGFSSRERSHPPGQIAPDTPLQRNLENGASIALKDYVLTPRAKFSLTARVLSSKRYSMDAGAALAPIDIAFGWGPMSDTALLNRLKISQSGRFYFWQYKEALPVSQEVIIRSSANMHLIPASDSVKRKLNDARVGDVLELHGELVDAKRADNWRWNTSLTREDSGGGACELVYVTSVEWR